jgi:hypothetical protein
VERGTLERGTLERGTLFFTFSCYLSIFWVDWLGITTRSHRQ